MYLACIENWNLWRSFFYKKVSIMPSPQTYLVVKTLQWRSNQNLSMMTWFYKSPWISPNFPSSSNCSNISTPSSLLIHHLHHCSLFTTAIIICHHHHHSSSLPSSVTTTIIILHSPPPLLHTTSIIVHHSPLPSLFTTAIINHHSSIIHHHLPLP